MRAAQSAQYHLWGFGKMRKSRAEQDCERAVFAATGYETPYDMVASGNKEG
jgi:hypothetical protein